MSQISELRFGDRSEARVLTATATERRGGKASLTVSD